MKGLNLSGFKKIKEDAQSATMIHKDGHQIMVAKSSLKPIQLEQLKKLPMHMESGGMTPSDQPQPGWVQNPDPLASMMGGPEVIQDPRQQQSAPQSFSVNYDPSASDGSQFSGSQPPAQPAQQDQPSSAAPPAQDQQAMPASNTGLQAQMAANDQLAKAEGDQGKQAAEAIGNTENQLAGMKTTSQIQQDYFAADDAYKQYLNKHDIDPNHFWADKSTGQKIAAGIGLFLGGFSTPFTHQGNPALQIINNAVEKDIEAQKANMGKVQSLWAMNRDAMKDDLAANLATRNQAYAGLQNTILKIAATNQSPIAQAKAVQLNAVIKQQMDINNYKRSLISGPTADNADPATRVNVLVEPSQRAKVFDEIKAAQATVQSAPQILAAFDRAAKANHAKDYIPGMENADAKALHALMGPTFQDIEGTVRQAAMDNMNHNTTPRPWADSASEIATKRDALVGYLTSKSHAPVARGNGIQLDKFPSTNVQGAVQNAQQPVKGADGKMYMRQGNFMVPVK